MDYFATNLKGSTDLKGYDLPTSVHTTKKSKFDNTQNSLEQTVIKSRGKSKFTRLVNLRKFDI